MDASSAMIVEVGAGAWSALLLTLAIYVPGWAWAGAPRPTPHAGRRGARFLEFGATALLAGLAIQLVTILALAECGVFSRRLHVAFSIAWFLAGLAVTMRGRLADGTTWRFICGNGWPGVAIMAIGCWLVMLMPQRGEWLAGGWDPGIYINQGVSISRTGEGRFAPDPVFSLLADEEIEFFTRQSFNFTEALPVVPLDVASRRPLHFFFKLTPSAIALLDRCGGLRAATRLNTFVGFWLFLMLAAAVGGASGRPDWGWFAAAALLVQPIFIYHLHIPTSEMLHVLLMAGLLFALSFPGTWARAWAGAVLLLLAQVNRFSFFPFGGVWLLLLTWFDAERQDRGRVFLQRCLQVACLAAGVLYDARVNAVTLGRLGDIVGAILVAGAGLCAVGLAAEASLCLPRWRAFAIAAAERGIPIVAFGGAAVLSLAGWFGAPCLPDEFRHNIMSALPYVRWAIVPAALGIAALALTRIPRAIRMWAVLLLAGSLAALFGSQIMKLQPWATRRQLEFAVPLTALCIGLCADLVWRLSPRTWRTPVLALLAGLLVWGQGGRIVRAWRVTEYNGMSRRMAEIAARIAPGDIVVADHFVWATPLRLIHNLPVINGELYHAADSRAKFERALAVLRRLRDEEGRTIRFLTSTEDGLKVFSSHIASATLDWVSEPYDYVIVAHAPTARDFIARPRRKEFRLYTWAPPLDTVIRQRD